MNPLAVFICNAKLRALATPAGEIEAALKASLCSLKGGQMAEVLTSTVSDLRLVYLAKWFPLETVALLEQLHASINKHGGRSAPVLLSFVSDLLRDYSLQEPSDLRI